MSTASIPAKRHALGLPAGSVRAAHVIGVVALTCAIIVVPSRGVVAIPPYLIYLLFLMLGHYFAAHGVSIATRDDPAPSPLYLPGGVVRALIVIALCGSIGWKLYDNMPGLRDQFTESLRGLEQQPFLPLVILGGFFLGAVVRAMVGRNNPPRAWQDIEAWISLIGLIGLTIAAVIHLVVLTSVADTIMMPTWEGIVGGVVAFYFVARS